MEEERWERFPRLSPQFRSTFHSFLYFEPLSTIWTLGTGYLPQKTSTRSWFGGGGSIWRLACTQTLFYFSFRSFGKHQRARFIFYHARLTDFEKKMEGLWTGYMAFKQSCVVKWMKWFSCRRFIHNNCSGHFLSPYFLFYKFSPWISWRLPFVVNAALTHANIYSGKLDEKSFWTVYFFIY